MRRKRVPVAMNSKPRCRQLMPREYWTQGKQPISAQHPTPGPMNERAGPEGPMRGQNVIPRDRGLEKQWLRGTTAIVPDRP